MNQLSQKNALNPMIFVQIAILVIAFTILFGTTIVSLAKDWMTNDNYSHGFFVPLIAGYMVWQKKSQLKKIRTTPNNLGLVAIFCGMCIFIIGNIGAELFTMRSAIVITIAGVCIYIFGARVTAAIAVPLIYLMFMVPLPAIIWNKIAFPLQLGAAKCTSNVVQLFGIPLLREGNVLHLPNTTLEVVGACSGLRSLTSLLALSAAFAYILTCSSVGKWILFISAIPIAVVVNVLRLTSTALMATYIGPQAAQGFLHEVSGVIVFVGAFVILFAVYLTIVIIEKKLRSE